MTDIYIISGFLGAGKTTLIQKLLSEALAGKTVALIENDFGEINIDAALLKKSGIQVKALDSGCICCTLTGDFIAALGALLKTQCPEVIIIEPSGVGKLSDVENACQNKAITPFARIAGKITVVDAKRFMRYLENFGEFFEDQVAHADTLLFSRGKERNVDLEQARELVEHLNPTARIFMESWESLNAVELLGYGASDEALPVSQSLGKHEHEGCSCCGHHAHDHMCCHEHNHGDHTQHAPEVFDTLTLRFPQTEISSAAVKEKFSALETSEYGTVLRAKGILRGTHGFLELQFLPGDLTIKETDVIGSELCVIGRNLRKERIIELFSNIGRSGT